MNDSLVFRQLLSEELGNELSSVQIDRMVRFREEVLRENEVQNLTRILAPRDFIDGHVLDAIHLEKTGFLAFPALDLGAGMGVPGLLHALIYTDIHPLEWISCDSEKKKAEFSLRMIDLFDLGSVSAASTRAEEYLTTHPEVKTIVSRAVGTVSKLYQWIRPSSTWNKLILLKGPKWEEEWAEFQKSSQRNRLVLNRTYQYKVGADQKQRVIVELIRK